MDNKYPEGYQQSYPQRDMDNSENGNTVYRGGESLENQGVSQQTAFENQFIGNNPEQTYSQTYPQERKKSASNKIFTKLFISGGVCAMALVLCLFFGTAVGGIAGVADSFIPHSADSKEDDEQETAVNSSADSKSEDYKNLSAKTVNIVKDAKPSVVCIATKSIETGYFNIQYEESGSGSGVIFHKTANNVYIVTNYHVIEGASTAKVSLDGENFVDAQLVGKESKSDLAVISVSLKDLEENGFDTDNITVAKFGDSESVIAGSQVIAIGNALGEGITATKGVVSDVNKEIDVNGNNLNVLQTDAAINPGNSGGALINAKGEVIGINTAKLSSDTAESIGYSITSNDVKTIVEKIIRNEKSPFIGIYMSDIPSDFAQYYNLETAGAMVTKVIPNTGAEKAGLEANDIITGFNSSPIFNKEQLSEELAKCKVGDIVEVKIIRNGKTNMTLKIQLTEEPDTDLYN
jgi:serine protease Do